MSISGQYFKYLSHLGQTVTLREFARQNLSNLIALRHDVDYDLDLALEMSYWEHEHQIQSTYYLLHTADYWQDPQLIDKCLQIQDFGHEVGLHLNVLTEWMDGTIDDVSQRLTSLIQPLHDAGVQITGISAHGDRSCYQHHYINYWCFKELRPADPQTESGLSAEGIPSQDSRFHVTYPSDHYLKRQDGQLFPLWSLSMADYGLSYDAIHTQYDEYYTDSGGAWKRSEDPLERSLQTGRHQVLIHPIYWRGQQKIYFFLSTARTGSTWLTQMLNQATPILAQHEFTLNHRYTEQLLTSEKRTSHGFTELINSPKEVKQLLAESRAWIEEQPTDYAEANVYLERFPLLLQEVFPEAQLIHLYRSPRDVVRSLMNRDWYDTPQDTRHPILPIYGWQTMDQFSKVCWYVRQTNESLMMLCRDRLQFERMVTDMDYFVTKLQQIGIPVYPRLLTNYFGQKVNVNRRYDFPEYQSWSVSQKAQFHAICDPVAIELGYRPLAKIAKDLYTKLVNMRIWIHQLKQRWFNPDPISTPSPDSENSAPGISQIYQVDFTHPPSQDEAPQPFTWVGCQPETSPSGLKLVPSGDRNAYFLIWGGSWYDLGEEEGLAHRIAHYYNGTLYGQLTKGMVQVFGLMYNHHGKLLEKRSLGQLQSDKSKLEFSFRPRSDVNRFNIALYMSVSSLPDYINLQKIEMKEIPN